MSATNERESLRVDIERKSVYSCMVFPITRDHGDQPISGTTDVQRRRLSRTLSILPSR